jgi:hypothetical protein
MRQGDLLQWADALGVAAADVPRTLRPLVRGCRELLDETARMRGRIHRGPDRDIDRAFMAMERNLTFVNQALGDALVDAGREVNP